MAAKKISAPARQVADALASHLQADASGPPGTAAAPKLPKVDFDKVAPAVVEGLFELAGMARDGELDRDESGRLALRIFDLVQFLRSRRTA